MSAQTSTENKVRLAPATSPTYKPTAGALLDLAVATENGSLRDHPLRKVAPGLYGTIDLPEGQGFRLVAAKVGGKWTVTDRLTDVVHPASGYEHCRLVANQIVGERLDGAPAVQDGPSPEKVAEVTEVIATVGRRAAKGRSRKA